jgi:hypothetical protein
MDGVKCNSDAAIFREGMPDVTVNFEMDYTKLIAKKVRLQRADSTQGCQIGGSSTFW